MLNIKKNTVTGFKNREISYTLLSNAENSSSLAVFLPGQGYMVQAPLFHYATGIFLQKSYDVLHVNYQYNDAFYDDFSREEMLAAIQFDVHAVLDKVLSDCNYERHYVLAKSLGTLAMNSVLERDSFQDAKAIWMTPLIQRDDVLEAMVRSKHKGLCFIGDKDFCYSAERFSQVLENPVITSHLIPGVEHGLQYEDDPVKSIDVLKNVMSELDSFSE